jgi:hypothetical protein
MLDVKIDKEFIVNDTPNRGPERRGVSILTTLSFRGGCGHSLGSSTLAPH